MNPILKLSIGALAVIGALALVAGGGMAFMHFSMMGG